MMPGGASPLPLESVALHPDYERMLVVVAGDGSRWHYLQTNGGELELGRPYLAPPLSDEHGLFTVHLWAPLAPGALPRVLKVERH